MARQWQIGLGFGLLCVVSGSAWILDQFWSNPLSVLQRQLLSEAAVAFLVLAIRVGRRRSTGSLFSVENVRTAGLGVAWFALPGLAAAGARGHVEQFTSALVYTLVPTMVVLVAAQGNREFGVEREGLKGMLPALAGCGGAALLFPFQLPSEAVGLSWFGAVLVAAALSGVAVVRMHEQVRGKDWLDAALLTAAASALCTLAGCAVEHAPRPAVTYADLAYLAGSLVLISAPVLLLAIWLVGRMPPVAFSSRYLLVPAVTIVEGLALLRPEVTWTTPAGLVLMMGAGWLLLWPGRQAALQLK